MNKTCKLPCAKINLSAQGWVTFLETTKENQTQEFPLQIFPQHEHSWWWVFSIFLEYVWISVGFASSQWQLLTHTLISNTSSQEIWSLYPGSHTLATQPGTRFPLKWVEEHGRSPVERHFECMSMRCKWQECIVRWALSGSAMWHSWMGCRGWLGGEDGSIYKGPLKGCRLGTRLALVLLPFHGMAGGGHCLVLSEWRDYFWLDWREEVYYHFLHSVDEHYVTMSFVICNFVLFLWLKMLGHCAFSTTFHINAQWGCAQNMTVIHSAPTLQDFFGQTELYSARY